MKTFTFNGKTSDELGLVIKNMPPVPRAERDITSLEISGKSGSLHIDNNSWKSKRYTIECICKDTTKADLLKSTLWGTHKLTLSTYSDREFIATIKNQIDFDNYLTYLQSFPLELELQPFGYDTTETTTTIGKEYVTAEAEDITLNNTGVASLEIGLKGNTSQEGTPTPDNPQEVQVVTGDNTIIVGNRNLWDEEWELGLINSSTGAKMNGTATIRTKNYIPVRPNTSVYYLNGTDAMWVFAYDKNKNFLGYATGGSSSVSGVARTTPADCYYLMFQCRSQYGTTYNNDICISYSDSLDGTYTPYQSQEYEINLGTLELCKIGTYQDYLYKSGENWYKHTEIGKITLNGSESWNYRNDYQTFYISNATSKGTKAPISNYFKGIASGITSNDNVILFNTTTLFVRYLSMSGVISDFKTWLGTHNTIVYYPLATPTEEQITNAELIEQLNDILNAVSYEDQTNISQENDDMAFILDVSALKKGTDKAVINNSGNVEVAPIITVGSQGTLTVNGYSIETTEDNITIDCELMECYNGTIAKNNKVILSEFPVLSVGNNNVVAQTANNITIKHKRGWL